MMFRSLLTRRLHNNGDEQPFATPYLSYGEAALTWQRTSPAQAGGSARDQLHVWSDCGALQRNRVFTSLLGRYLASAIAKQVLLLDTDGFVLAECELPADGGCVQQLTWDPSSRCVAIRQLRNHRVYLLEHELGKKVTVLDNFVNTLTTTPTHGSAKIHNRMRLCALSTIDEIAGLEGEQCEEETTCPLNATVEVQQLCWSATCELTISTSVGLVFFDLSSRRLWLCNRDWAKRAQTAQHHPATNLLYSLSDSELTVSAHGKRIPHACVPLPPRREARGAPHMAVSPEGTVAWSMGSKKLLVYHTDDTRPLGFQFSQDYGKIRHLSWLWEGMVLVAFNEGFVVVLATEGGEMGTEVACYKVHNSLYHVQYNAFTNTLAVSGDAGVHILCLHAEEDRDFECNKRLRPLLDQLHTLSFSLLPPAPPLDPNKEGELSDDECTQHGGELSDDETTTTFPSATLPFRHAPGIRPPMQLCLHPTGTLLGVATSAGMLMYRLPQH